MAFENPFGPSGLATLVNIPSMNDQPTNKNSTADCSKSTAGFTLVELLTVITILAVLAALVLPTIGTIRENSWKAVSISNIRQIYQLTIANTMDNNGIIPYAGFAAADPRGNWYTSLRQMNDESAKLFPNPITPTTPSTIRLDPLQQRCRPTTKLSSYAMNYWATVGRLTSDSRRLATILQPAKTALFSVGPYSASKMGTDIIFGRPFTSDGFPEMVFPIRRHPEEIHANSGIDNPDRYSSPVVYVDGHAEFLALSKFPQEIEDPFWGRAE